MARSIDREVLLGFLAEVRGYLPQIRRCLGVLSSLEEPHGGDAETDAGAANLKPAAERRAAALEEIHRLLHSIKGASSMLGLTALSQIAYSGERALDDLELHDRPSDAAFVQLIERTTERVGSAIDDLAAGRASHASTLAAAIVDYRRWSGLPEDGDAEEIASASPLAPDETAALDATDSPDSTVDPLASAIESAVDAWVESSLGRADLAPPKSDSTAKPNPLEDLAPPRSLPSPPARPPLGFATSADLAADLLLTFREEAQEHLGEIQRGLRDLAADGADRAALQLVRRRVHTLKGAASLVGMGDLSRLAHRMEDLLDGQVDGVIAESDEVRSLRFSTADALEDLSQGGLPETSLDELYRRYDALLGPAETTEGVPSARFVSTADTSDDETAVGFDLDPSRFAGSGASTSSVGGSSSGGGAVRVPIERLDDLSRFASELVVHRSVFERHFAQLARRVEELTASNERLRNIAQRLDRETEARTLSGARSPLASLVGAQATAGGVGAGLSAGIGEMARGGFEFDALELDRYSEFHLLSRELTETASDLHAVGGELGDSIGDFDAYLSRLGRLTSEVQNGLLRLRMVPLAGLAARLHRTVRVTAEQKGKQVELAIVGAKGEAVERVELDKTVLEAVADPLLHLLRNAVDHGIEPRALRVALGKPAVGRIELRAYYEGTQVVLEVVDDGAGIDPAAVRATAVANGLVTIEEAERLDSEQLLGILFSSGFSTATALSEVSGRGVGLDIVKSAAERLEGSVAVESTLGSGTKFSIRLPMTLAVTRVLMVAAGGETYAVPLSAVRRIARIEASDLEALGHEPVLTIEGRVFPVLRLSEVFGGPSGQTSSLGERPAVLVLDLGDRSIALLVDGHLQAREVVVKPLGSFLKKVHGILGATLTGDGDVVLIVNPTELGRDALESRGWSGLSASLSVPAEPRPAARSLNVMVVDDSLSVRRVLTNLLQGVGWSSVAARDGLEALELLERTEALPDVLLLDIEMPRMDGYELTATLRGAAEFRDLPIIMLTSRSGEKHRRRAFDLGVSEYLVKPYQEDTLLSVIRSVVRSSEEARQARRGKG